MPDKRFAMRILIFIAGFNFIALGVSLTTRAALGTTPIAAIPYSLSLVFSDFSFGSWVVVFNLSLIVAEYILLRGKIKLTNIAIQSLLALAFGSLIDGYMYILACDFPGYYLFQIGLLMLGCIAIALGACLEIIANVSMLPGDAFTLSISLVTNMDFGRIRVLSDISMSLIAVVICLVSTGEVLGVREGTIVAALATGIIVKMILNLNRKLSPTRS